MAGKGAKNKEPGSLAKFYLLAYNLGQVVGWTYMLYQLQGYYLGLAGKETLWNTVETTVIIFQNAAVLEILHAVTGLVSSNPVITTFQVFSRVMVVCGVILATPPEYAAASPGLPLALTAWSITEIIRYLYYFLNLIGQVPHPVVWLRYTMFIILYPIGITGELLCIYAAHKYAQVNSTAWSYTLPNAWNFTFNYHYLLLVVALLYIPRKPIAIVERLNEDSHEENAKNFGKRFLIGAWGDLMLHIQSPRMGLEEFQVKRAMSGPRNICLDVVVSLLSYNGYSMTTFMVLAALARLRICYHIGLLEICVIYKWLNLQDFYSEHFDPRNRR